MSYKAPSPPLRYSSWLLSNSLPSPQDGCVHFWVGGVLHAGTVRLHTENKASSSTSSVGVSVGGVVVGGMSVGGVVQVLA